jgi:hypothetical protein
MNPESKAECSVPLPLVLLAGMVSPRCVPAVQDWPSSRACGIPIPMSPTTRLTTAGHVRAGVPEVEAGADQPADQQRAVARGHH